MVKQRGTVPRGHLAQTQRRLIKPPGKFTTVENVTSARPHAKAFSRKDGCRPSRARQRSSVVPSQHIARALRP